MAAVVTSSGHDSDRILHLWRAPDAVSAVARLPHARHAPDAASAERLHDSLRWRGGTGARAAES